MRDCDREPAIHQESRDRPADGLHFFIMAAPLLAAACVGHGSMIMPPSRNAMDATLPPWQHGRTPPTGVIEPYKCACTNGTSGCDVGQACFWFSQGCTIGCSVCDGQGQRLPNWDHCPAESLEPTLNDPKYRTANLHAKAGSAPGQG